jgi:hypothetical protein
MELDWSMKVGDVLTSLTIAVSVIALIISWSKDRSTRESERADRVRAAASKAHTKLDRWQALHRSLYQELQPTFIEASEMLQDGFNMVKTRDHLWKAINAQRTRITAKMLDEQIETAYVDLLSHFPAARSLFLDTFAQLKTVENEITERFLVATQNDVLSFKDRKPEYTTAMLGNALRSSAAQHSHELYARSNETIQPVRKFLFDVIVKSDRDILRATREIPSS